MKHFTVALGPKAQALPMAHAIRPASSFPSLAPSLAGAAAIGLDPVLDALPIGVVLLDGALRVRRANAKARAILERGDTLAVVAGTLAAVRAVDDGRLQGALHALHARPASAGDGVRLEVSGRDGAAGLALHLRAVRSPEHGWLACVSIEKSDASTPPAEALPQVHGLSPRRREVLSRLLGGERPGDIARELGISEHTVRAYVKDLHRHFGAHSRGELLARFIPATRQ